MLCSQCVFHQDRHGCLRISSDAMQQQIHSTEPGNTVYEFDASKLLRVQVTELRLVKLLAADEPVCCQQKSACTTCRITDDKSLVRLGPRPWLHHVHDRLDQGARSEVLPCAALDVLRVLLQQPLVGVTLHVD